MTSINKRNDSSLVFTKLVHYKIGDGCIVQPLDLGQVTQKQTATATTTTTEKSMWWWCSTVSPESW
jgi:hypothetical protein